MPPYSPFSSTWLNTSPQPLHQFWQMFTRPLGEPVAIPSSQKTNPAKTGEYFASSVKWIQSVRFPVGARASIRWGLGLHSHEQQCRGITEGRRCKTAFIVSYKLVSLASCLASPSGWRHRMTQTHISCNPPFAQLLLLVPVLILLLHQHKSHFSHLINCQTRTDSAEKQPFSFVVLI